MKFRRQHPVGPCVVDFYCAAVKLAVEIDGASHDMGDRPQRDAIREDFLRSQGIETLRIEAGAVLASPVELAVAVVEACRDRGA